MNEALEALKPAITVLGPYIAIGMTGSLLEWIGMRAGIPGLERLGKMLESIGADLPKTWTNMLPKRANDS